MTRSLSDDELAVLKRIANKYIATDKELEGAYADKEVKKDPPRWNVEENGSFVGRKWSECPPAYLEMLAEFMEWRADQDKVKPADQQRRKTPQSKPYWVYDESDARLLRGWARKNRRTGPAEVAKAAMPEPVTDDDVPF